MIANGTWCSRRLGLSGGALLALLLSAACAPATESGVIETADDPALLDALAPGDALNLSVGVNGISQNGISQNGITQNGISQNGIAGVALTGAGISTTAFATWFNTNPALREVLMRYVYRCAGSSWTSLVWTNPSTGVKYTWPGALGLAPGWTGGATATVAEQQVVTACLGALTNKYGASVTIAVEGRTASGTKLAVGPTELATYSVREACFFGNLFASQGVFLANDFSSWSAAKSTARGCALGGVGACPPMVSLPQQCAEVCTPDTTGTFWESCTWNGTVFKPLTTRLKPADVYICGDGVCQFTEQCGSAWTVANCRDCGLCEF